MAFLVCENEDATSTRMTSERLWSSIRRCGDTGLHTYKITSINQEIRRQISSSAVLLLQYCKCHNNTITSSSLLQNTPERLFSGKHIQNIVKFRVVKRSSKIRSSIYKFEFEFSFLAFAIRSVIVPRGMHSIKCTIALSALVAHGCSPSTGGRRGEIRLRNRNCDGR